MTIAGGDRWHANLASLLHDVSHEMRSLLAPEIEALGDGTNVQVTVRDYGSGILASEIETMFQTLSRGSNATTDGYRFGIGHCKTGCDGRWWSN